MQYSADVLKLRTLLCFLNKEDGACTVTKIARTLGVEKYSISRAMGSLEEEGLVNRENKRMPMLTEEGKKVADRYAERIRISVNHLMYEGVDMNSAKEDAFYWALYNSEKSMEVFRNVDVRYHVKYELSEKKEFSGAALCKKMPDGTYSFPFLIYHTKMENGSNISWANNGFEKACLLTVKDGIGIIQLRTRLMNVVDPRTENAEEGYFRSMKYFELGEYVDAEYSGSLVSFPAAVLHFINVGSGVGRMLHGSVCVKLESVVAARKRSEYDAVFTILI